MRIADKDIGRKVRLRNGRECVLERTSKAHDYYDTHPYFATPYGTVTPEGRWGARPEQIDRYDVVAFVDDEPTEPVAKPWDKLRDAKPPIGVGVWRTSNVSAGVGVEYVGSDRVSLCMQSVDAPCSQSFCAADLRELAEFCNELADQLDEG